jgi:hypothetical protein
MVLMQSSPAIIFSIKCMKMKTRIYLFTAMAIAGAVACNDSTDTTTTTDSTSSSMNATTTGGETGTSMQGSTTINIRPDANYVDLKTGKQVRLRIDSINNYIVNADNSEPIYYYIDPSTNDTFDRIGQNVSGALIRGTDGSYTVDESRLKVKVQDDGDMKVKDGEGNKVKVDPNDDKVKMKSADGSKESLDGNKYKSKTDSGKTKNKQ